MLSITDLKKGTLVELEGKPYKVIEYAQKTMGRGGSIVNTKLKNLLDGSVVAKTFKGADKVEAADVITSTAQYLYSDGTTLHFMNPKTYDQFEVAADVIGDDGRFMKEGLEVMAQSFNGRTINIDLPVKVPLAVTEAPEVVKGDTQSTVQKEVTLETGAKVQAPMFIKPGDVIIVDSRDGSYVERQK
jgi:elongation factor P